jgi:hypothetical protein
MTKKNVYYALFQAHPSTEPPFNVELGFSKDDKFQLTDCKNIPEAVERILEYCKTNSIEFNSEFTLIYPIYLDAMDSEHESTMHSIAWLIKDQTDLKKWKFDRIGGYSGLTTQSFIPK